MTTTEMTINEALLEDLQKKLKKMNAKAVKLGMAPVTVEVVELFEELRSRTRDGKKPLAGYRVLRDDKEFWAVTMARINVTGTAPKIAGHEFVATVDLRGDDPLVRPVPFVENVDLTRFFTTDAHCDHCNSARRRNDVLVLREVATGALIQIGRNCAADFFRSTDATAMIHVGESVFGGYACDDEDAWGGMKSDPSLPLHTVLAQAAAVVRQFGYVSVKMVERDSTLASTRGRVRDNLFPWPKMPAEDKVTPNADDIVEGVAVMSWLQQAFIEKPEHLRSDFDRSVRAAIDGKDTGALRVRVRNLNYVIWAIDGYKRELEKRVQKQVENSRAQASAHVGIVGSRIDMELTLKFRRTMGSHYGQKALCKFVDAAGNTVIWWGTSDAAFAMKLDQTYAVKATIKAHGEYEGAAQTEITRVAVDLPEEV